jgi:integrase
MPKLRNKLPSYCRHKASGQAVVTLDGRDRYLGTYGTQESYSNYEQLVAKWLAMQKTPEVCSTGCLFDDLRVCELLAAYLDFAKSYYVKNGRQTGEYVNLIHAVEPLTQLFSESRVSDFRPRDLKVVRQMMVDNDLSRKVINQRINRIRRIFKWGVENDFVESSVLHALQAIAPLKAGRTNAKERAAIGPVPQEHVDVVIPLATRQVGAMIRVQEHTGMRPGEVVIMRMKDVDMSGSPWVYTPSSHKTEHHGILRSVWIGPRAQEVLQPFLKADPEAYLFSPRDELAARSEERRAGAKHSQSSNYKRKSSPKRTPGKHYTPSSYCYAIHKACKKADIPVWGPNRLRHNAATMLRKQFGIEAARVVLGHTSAAMTEVYAEVDRKKAADIMASVG